MRSTTTTGGSNLSIDNNPTIINEERKPYLHLIASKLWNDDSSIVKVTVAQVANLCGENGRDQSQHFNRAEFGRVGVPLAILNFMEKYSDDLDIQVESCRALMNLAHRNTENQDVIAQVGAADHVAQAMKRFPTHGNMQRFGCGTLGNLAFKKENRMRVIDANAICLIISAMGRHPWPQLQRSACGALVHLVMDTENQKGIADACGIPCIIKAMESNPGSPDLQRYACFILYKLASYDDEMKLAIVRENGLLAITRALEEHSENPHVVKRAAAALEALEFHSEDTKKLAAIGLANVQRSGEPTEEEQYTASYLGQDSEDDDNTTDTVLAAIRKEISQDDSPPPPLFDRDDVLRSEQADTSQFAHIETLYNTNGRIVPEQNRHDGLNEKISVQKITVPTRSSVRIHPVPLFFAILEGELIVDYGSEGGVEVFRQGDSGSGREAFEVEHRGTNEREEQVTLLCIFKGSANGLSWV